MLPASEGINTSTFHGDSGEMIKVTVRVRMSTIVGTTNVWIALKQGILIVHNSGKSGILMNTFI